MQEGGAVVGLFLPFCPALRQFSRMRIDPAWVSLAWHYLAQCTERNSVMGSDVILSCWNKLVGWSHSPVVYGWVAEPCVLNPSILLTVLIAVVQFDGPSPHPLGWEFPYFLSLGVWGGRSYTCRRPASGWGLVCLSLRGIVGLVFNYLCLCFFSPTSLLSLHSPLP